MRAFGPDERRRHNRRGGQIGRPYRYPSSIHRDGMRYAKALKPVIAWPRMSVWMSSVPS